MDPTNKIDMTHTVTYFFLPNFFKNVPTLIFYDKVNSYNLKDIKEVNFIITKAVDC